MAYSWNKWRSGRRDKTEGSRVGLVVDRWAPEVRNGMRKCAVLCNAGASEEGQVVGVRCRKEGVRQQLCKLKSSGVRQSAPVR